MKTIKTTVTELQYQNALRIVKAYNYEKASIKLSNKLTYKTRYNQINLTDNNILTQKDIELIELHIKETSVKKMNVRLSKNDLINLDINEFYARKGVTKFTINRLLNFYDCSDVFNGKKIDREKIFKNLTKTITKETKKVIKERLTIQKQILLKKQERAKAQEEAKLLKEQKAKERAEERKQKKIQDEIYKKLYEEHKALKLKERQERKLGDSKSSKERQALALKRKEINAQRMVKTLDPIYNKKDENGNFLFFYLENVLKTKTCIVLRQYFNVYKGYPLNLEVITRDELLEVNLHRFFKIANFKKGVVNEMINFVNNNNIPTSYEVDMFGKLVMKENILEIN